MKVGDLVTDEYNEDAGIVVTQPRRFPANSYEVVDVLCPDGCVRQFTTDELRIISESR